MRLTRIFATAAVLLAVGGLVFAQTELVGAGATFPAPLYTKMFDQYGSNTGLKINYQAIGSGGGITQIKNKTVDFGATDTVMTEKDHSGEPAPLVHIPVAAGSVVITYNLPGNPELKLTSDVTADIFLGKLTRWDDARLAALNPAAKLPKLAITVVHRSDGSGTTGVFSSYLGKVSDDWNNKVGVGQSLNWPAGVGAKGNPGVAGLVQQLPGSVGYVELIYALQNSMPFALLKNKSGNFIKASLASTTAAANVPVPDDVTKLSLTNTDVPDGYPISSITWLLVYKEQSYDNRTRARADAMMKMIWWMIHDGQKLAEPLSYAVLPAGVVSKAEALVRSITFNGVPLYQ